MVHKYSTVSSRIGLWKADILAQASYVQTLPVTKPEMTNLPAHSSKTAVFRRWLPFGDVDNEFVTAGTSDAAAAYATSHMLAEGVTPSPDQISQVDVSATIKQYGMLYSFTDATFQFHEDNIPEAITEQLGKRRGTLEEQINFSALQSTTNVLYAGGGVSRASVNGVVKLPGLRIIARRLADRSGGMMTTSTRPGTGEGSAPLEGGWIVVTNTDAISTFRDMDGWVKKEQYAGATPLHPFERGSVEEFRIIATPHLKPVLSAGATGTTGLKSADSTHVDVYQTLVFAEKAWGTINPAQASTMKPILLPPNKVDKTDPLGQFGLYGMQFWTVSMILNQGWIYKYEHGVDALTGAY
jgi:N4-gp56 family major capsid protein